jgi:predicted ATPase
MASPGAVIYSFDHKPVQRIDYEQTDHYLVYKAFLDNPEICLSAGKAESK